MITLERRIKAFAELGKLLRIAADSKLEPQLNDDLLQKINNEIAEAKLYNGWFTEDNVRQMIREIAISLEENNLNYWISSYKECLERKTELKVIGVVMAGNIPLVGFHDFVCVLISGNKLLAKLSSDDNRLLPVIGDILKRIEPGFSDLIKFTDGKIEKPNAIIATGSNNSSRYFEYYFGKYPNIIRKNRNGVAVITGNESEDDLMGISNDIFSYYGLGCRNVSHLYVPADYDFGHLISYLQKNDTIIQNSKYFNNYEYNKAIFLVNNTHHIDTGNLLLYEDTVLSTPVSVVSFEYYSDLKNVEDMCKLNEDKIQCIVTVPDLFDCAIKPGSSQSPRLWDYADNVDTMEFLCNL